MKLYTDTIPDKYFAPALRTRPRTNSLGQDEYALVNNWFQTAAFGSSQLPLYVILEPLPDGKIKVVGIYDEGKINDERAFAEFLERPLKANAGTVRTAQAAPK